MLQRVVHRCLVTSAKAVIYASMSAYYFFFKHVCRLLVKQVKICPAELQVFAAETSTKSYATGASSPNACRRATAPPTNKDRVSGQKAAGH